MIKRIDITGVQGTPMRAVLIPAHETSLNFAVTATEDLIEFYDGRYPHTSDGQFITRYYASTLLDSHAGIPAGGLDLMGYESSWKIDGRTLKMVLDWIAYHQYVKP
jgi:hypothetical protein